MKALKREDPNERTELIETREVVGGLPAPSLDISSMESHDQYRKKHTISFSVKFILPKASLTDQLNHIHIIQGF